MNGRSFSRTLSRGRGAHQCGTCRSVGEPGMKVKAHHLTPAACLHCKLEDLNTLEFLAQTLKSHRAIPQSKKPSGWASRFQKRSLSALQRLRQIRPHSHFLCSTGDPLSSPTSSPDPFLLSRNPGQSHPIYMGPIPNQYAPPHQATNQPGSLASPTYTLSTTHSSTPLTFPLAHFAQDPSPGRTGNTAATVVPPPPH